MKIIFSKTDYLKKQQFRLQSMICKTRDKLFILKKSNQNSIIHLEQLVNNIKAVDVDGKVKTPIIISSNKSSLKLEFVQGESFEQKISLALQEDPLFTNKLIHEYVNLAKLLSHEASQNDRTRFLHEFSPDNLIKKKKWSNDWLRPYYFDFTLSNIIQSHKSNYFIDPESWFSYDFPLELLIARSIWQQVIVQQVLIKRAISPSFVAYKILDGWYCPASWLREANMSAREFTSLISISNSFYSFVLTTFNNTKVDWIEHPPLCESASLGLVDVADMNNQINNSQQKILEQQDKIKNLEIKVKDLLSVQTHEKELLLEVAEYKNAYQIAQTHLNQIYSGKTWKLLMKYFSLRDRIIKKVQQKIGFRRHFRRLRSLAFQLLKSDGVNQMSTEYQLLADQQIANELDSWLAKRKNDSLDFFVFGITAYEYRHQRPQHLVEQLVQNGHRVFYVENEFCTDEIDGKKLIEIKKHNNNIYLLKLHSDHNYFIYNQTPDTADVENFFNSIKHVIGEAKAINLVAKIDHPFWGCLQDKLSMPIIYDCMDDHSGFKENGDRIHQLESELIIDSDLVLVSSAVLSKKIKKIRSKPILMLRNGGEFEHFKKALSKSTEVPSDLLKIRNNYKKIIGYYGAIADWFDADLLEKVADEYPDSAVVLVGMVTNDQVKKLAEKYSNIFLLGEKKYSDLPSYLKGFDICTIPFQLIPLIQATNPVKIYEYLSAGKPVVVTDMPELRVLDKLIYRAVSHQDFIKLVGNALTEKVNTQVIRDRQDFALANTWQVRGKALNEQIQKQFFPLVSVVLLSYGKWEFSRDCFKSLYERTYYPRFETIFIDNKSDDETVDYIKKHIDGKYPNLTVRYQSKNTGFGGGNNIGMKLTKGEYIILLNNDTKVTPGWISRLVYHASRDGVGLVGPATNNIGNESKIEIEYDSAKQIEIENKATVYTSSHWGELLDLDRIAAFCWIKSRQTYKKLGGFDDLFFPAFFEDDDYCRRIKDSGLKIYCADDVFIHHHLSASTKADPAAHSKMFVDNKAKYEKKWKEKWKPHKYR